MYFAKNEVIELSDKKKYLVLNAAILDDEVYYQVQELNKEENQRIGDPIYITTINREGKIYINNRIPREEQEKIKELFED